MYTSLLTAAMAAKKLRLVKMNHCATMIQAQWRGFVNYLDYKAYMEEEHGATTIQKYWRGYRENMKLLYTLVHVITIQVSFFPEASLFVNF
jgi:myosin heavy subunit